MIDHETHLKNIIEAQKELAKELNELNNIMASKKESRYSRVFNWQWY